MSFGRQLTLSISKPMYLSPGILQQTLGPERVLDYLCRQELAEELFGPIRSENEVPGFVECPGGESHSTRGGCAEAQPPAAEIEHFKCFTTEELARRDKVNMDAFWLKDDALEESATCPHQ